MLRIWGLMQERVYRTPLRDTFKQRLIDTVGKCITKRHRRSCRSMEKRLCACIKTKGHHFEHLLNWNRHFSEPPTTLLRKMHYASRNFHRSYLKANKVSKTEGTRKDEYAYYFLKACWCCLLKIIKINPCLSKLHLAKVGMFLRHSVVIVNW